MSLSLLLCFFSDTNNKEDDDDDDPVDLMSTYGGQPSKQTV